MRVSLSYPPWVDPPIIRAAMRDDKLIEEEHVECRPEKIPCSILDENVDICLVRPYFTNDAWLIVEDAVKRKKSFEDAVKRKKSFDVWFCATCQASLEGTQAIICELCLRWYHFSCVGISSQPKKRNWFCRQCYC